MKSVSTALSFGLALFCTQLQAQDNAFQHEASVSYGDATEYNDSGTVSAAYTFYASPVDQSKAPYKLAGFLAQSSQLSATYVTNTDSDQDFDLYGLGGVYVFDSKWFIGGSFAKSDPDSTSYSAVTGLYFNDFSKFYIGYSDHESDSDTYDFTASTWMASISSYLRLQSTEGIMLDATVAHSKSDYSLRIPGFSQESSSTNTIGTIAADWYITRAWSVGANYSVDENDDTYGINTAYFLRITDSISAEFTLSHLFASGDYDGATNFYSIGLNGRF